MAVLGYPRLAYCNLVNLVATITAGTAETDNPAVNVGDENLHTFWKPNGTGWQYLKFDLLAPYAPTFLGVLGHTLFSSGVAQTQLKYGTADNGTNFENVEADWDVDAETSDYNKFFVFTGHSKRYWILTSNVVSTHPQIAVAFLGYATTTEMLSTPDERIEDWGVAVEESPTGHADAEQYAEFRKLITINAEGRTDAQRAIWQTIEWYHKNGLHPLCFMDMDTDSASGLCTYGRVALPLGWSAPAPDANDMHTRQFRQEI